ncbi:DUF6192 family protein [Streptomyces aculeolatus]
MEVKAMALGVPAGYERAQWESYVKQGRKLIKRISDAKFDLGDTVKEMLADRHGTTVESVLAAYARQIRANPKTLKDYRYVAVAWPQAMRQQDVPWSVHRVLAPHPRRFELLRGPAKTPDTGEETEWTYDLALREMDRLPAHPVTSEEKSEHVRHLLRDTTEAADAVNHLLERPDVARAVMGNPVARRSLRAADEERHQKIAQEAETAKEMAAAEAAAGTPMDDRPEAAVDYRQAPSVVLHVMGLCTGFTHSLRAAIPELQQLAVSDEAQQAVLEVLDSVREAVDWGRDAVRAEGSAMDDALARMLGSDGGDPT